MDWILFEHEVRNLAQYLIGETPDCIVAVVRGGLIPAALIARFLKVTDVRAIQVERGANADSITTPFEDMHGKKVLLIEDMIETGGSLKAAKEYLERKGAIVTTACLYTMPHSTITPDYFLKEVPEVVAFPWNLL